MARQERMQRDIWDKLEVLSKVLAAILLPIVLAVGGFLLNQSMERQKQQETERMEEQKQQETRKQLHMTLINQRESADSALRKDMFQHIIKSVVGEKNDAGKLRDQVLNLEVLAQNFHDSIDLRALFYGVERDLIDKSKPEYHQISEKERKDLRARLKRVAAEIRNRQFSALKELQNSAHFTIDLERVGEDYSKPPYVCVIPNKQTGKNDEYIVLSPSNKTKFSIRTQVLDKDEDTEELNVRVQIITKHDDGKVSLQAAEMWVGFYDFPAIDNLRLVGSDHRCAVILNQFEKSNPDGKEKANFAKISVIVFQGCRGSLKEKAYYEQVVENLTHQDARRPGSDL
jgi:hypothetical protein